MTTSNRTLVARLDELMASVDPSVRLRAAMVAGTQPDPGFVETLVAQSGTDPDFFVRDMMTWALTRHDPDDVVALLLPELTSTVPQARSQALHTLSKIGDRGVWQEIPLTLLHDADGEVARSAWRAMVALLPPGKDGVLAAELVRELGRGDHEVQRSLSRALAAVADAAEPMLAAAAGSSRVVAHAQATLRLIADPESDFQAALAHAQRVTIAGMGPEPAAEPESSAC